MIDSCETAKEPVKSRSLTITLTVAFLVLSLGILLLSSGLEIFFGFIHQKEIVTTQQHLIAGEAAGSVKNYIGKRLDLLNTAVHLGGILNASPTGRKELLNKILGQELSFYRIRLLDAGGKDLQDVSRKSHFSVHATGTESSNAIFSRVSCGAPYISPVYINEKSNEPLVTIAVPVTDAFGDFKGALLAEVNLKFMWEYIGCIKIGKAGLAYVVDREGTLLASTDISRVLKRERVGRLKEVAEFVNRTEQSTEKPAEISRGFRKTLVVSDHVELIQPDWAVVVELPVAEAFEPVLYKIKITAAIVLSCFILTLFVGVYLSRRIVRPIILLRNVAAEIGSGRFDTCSTMHAANEIGELAQSINQMSCDLQRTTTSIDNLNREIDERKRIEDALAESEQNFRKIFEVTSDGIAIVNQQTGRFESTNPAMCAIYGYSPEEFRYLTAEDITPEETKTAMRQTMRSLAEGFDIPEHEGISIKKDGSKVNMIVGNRNILWNGEPVYYFNFKDITYLKKIQEQLQKKNLEILEFTNVVTHDLRKPLTAMNTIFEMADQGMLGSLNENGVEAIATGLEASKFMQSMLEDLMTSARLESGTQQLEIEENSFRELLDIVINRLKYQIEEKDILLNIKREDVVVRADKKQLSAVLMNIVGNAVNYIGSGPIRRIRIGWEQIDGDTVFCVEDNGMGIPPGSQEHIFEKFKRGSNVADVTGTGLGLPIVKGIIEAHGGKIWFESEEGKGATFYFTIPGQAAATV